MNINTLFILLFGFTVLYSSGKDMQYKVSDIIAKIDNGFPATIYEWQVYANWSTIHQGAANVFANFFWIGNYVLGTIGGKIIDIFAIPIINTWWKRYKWKQKIKKLNKKYRFSRCLGYFEQVAQCKQIVFDIKEQKQSRNYKKSNGILFYGPPGCGKTNFVYTIASEADVPILKISLRELMNDQGVLSDNFDILCNLFKDIVQDIGPCILFFDEFDFCVSNRKKHTLGLNEKIVIQNFLDKLEDADGLDGVFVVACTNDIQAIDEALLRDGRLGAHIEIGLPTRDDVMLFYDKYCVLDKHSKIARRDEIITSSVGLSCATLIEKFSHLQ